MQPLLENAIRHGFPQGFKEGCVTISLQKDAKGLSCTIEDNGVGRHVAGQQPRTASQRHISRGLDLTRERLEVLSQRMEEQFSLQIEDLYDQSKQPAGTRISLKLPLL